MQPDSDPFLEGGTPRPDPLPRHSHASRPRLAALVLVVLVGVAAVGYDRLIMLQHEAAAVEAQARQASLDTQLLQRKKTAAEADAARQKAIAEAEAARRQAEAKERARQEAARQKALQADADRRKRERVAYERDAEAVVTALEGLESRLHSSLSYRDYLDLLEDVTRQGSSLDDRYHGTRFAHSASFKNIGLAIKAYDNAFEVWKIQNGVEEGSSAYDEGESLIQRCWSLGGRCVEDARSALARHN